MPYADTTRVKERSGVTAGDLAISDRDSDSDVDEDDLDLLIGELNELASETIDGYCQRDFEHHTGDTVTIDGNGRDSIRLPGYPVISVDTVKVGDQTLASDEYRVKTDAPGWEGENAGILERKSTVWLEGWQNLEVTYDWGYETPPGDVRNVAEELVVDALRAATANEKGAKGGVQSYSMDGFSVSFDESLSSLVGQLSEAQKSQLDAHKRVIIA